MDQQYLVSSWLIYTWLLLAHEVALQPAGEGDFIHGLNIRGPVFNHKNHEYFAPRKLPTIRY